jgi:hypothetical protein
MATKKGIVDISGKQYQTVAYRVSEFRKLFKPDDGWAIRTWLIHHDDDRVVIQASICDNDDHVVATGFAEEVRSQGKINATSALENCETSAVGRALAAFGLGGEEYCTADELLNALSQQEEAREKPPKKEEKKKPAPKPDPVTEIEKKLELLCEFHDDEIVQSWWVKYLKHSEFSKGELTLDGVKKVTTVTERWRMYDEFKAEATRAFPETPLNKEENNG